MTEPFRPSTVVGAVIVDRGRVLAARRAKPIGSAGQWEFPGGKVEPGEDPETALIREIDEELGVVITVGAELSDQPWPISTTYQLRLFLAAIAEGSPVVGLDHDQLRWLAAGDLDTVSWLPADRLALDAVRLRLG